MSGGAQERMVHVVETRENDRDRDSLQCRDVDVAIRYSSYVILCCYFLLYCIDEWDL